jgi:hypothetical protein
MTESTCPSLRRLGSLLRAAYRIRENRIASGGQDVAKAERDIRRVHNLITQHRASCRFCTFNEALQGLPTRYSSSHSNVIPMDRVH